MSVAEHVISLGPLRYEMSRLQEPMITIDPGDSVVVETEDAFSGQVRSPATSEIARRCRSVIPWRGQSL